MANRSAHVHRRTFRAGVSEIVQFAIVDWVWELRDDAQGWENVMRLHRYLAKRRLYDEYGDEVDLNSVRVSFPFLGPEATPENTMKALLQVDTALRNGDFEVIEDFDDGSED